MLQTPSINDGLRGIFEKKIKKKLISVILGNKRYKTPSTSFGLYVIYGKLVS